MVFSLRYVLILATFSGMACSSHTASPNGATDARPSSPLAITTTALPSGAPGTAYTAMLAASGGVPPYSWSVTAGSLPAGLSLAMSGSITGTPTALGNAAFTVQVSDAGSPSATVSAPLEFSIVTTWYIRGDGGTRYSVNQPSGQCDGMHDAAYPGSGVNQPCGFSDLRYLWADGSRAGSWAIAGGDTVLIESSYPTGQLGWRIGRAGPGGSSADLFDNWAGNGGLDPYEDYNPTIPPGTATQHTRFLGQNYANCTTKTQLFGGFAVSYVLNLASTEYVDVQCLELTDHAQCLRTGSPAYPASCSSNYPLDDYANSGIITDKSTHDIVLQDLNIHGFPSRGIYGSIGGLVTMNNVRLGFNGGAGWDFDDGSTSINNPTVNASDLTIEWSGCNEEYPITHMYPAISCNDDVSGGYGDAIGTPTLKGLNFTCDHCAFNYNTQDGLDLTHSYDSDIVVTNSIAVGNMGAGFKFGPQKTETLRNSISVSNCTRMSQPIAGAPSTYNANLTDFCRGANQVPFNFYTDASSVVTYEGNTFIGTTATVFDVACLDSGVGHVNNGCPTGTIVFRDNIILGYTVPSYNAGQQPGVFYFEDGLSDAKFSARENNLYYGVRNMDCSSAFPDELCGVDPLFMNEPSQTWSAESQLDGFDFRLAPGSPARGAGMASTTLTTDYNGNPRPSPPSMGAID